MDNKEKAIEGKGTIKNKKVVVETAKAVGKDLPISTKNSIEICSFIRGREMQKAKDMLRKAIEKKQAVPFKRFTNGAGHKKGMSGGKFPIKACTEILKIIELAESNAGYKGLNKGTLILKHVKADKASSPAHYGRKRGRSMKRTHIEIIVEEMEKKPKIEKDNKAK